MYCTVLDSTSVCLHICILASVFSLCSIFLVMQQNTTTASQFQNTEYTLNMSYFKLYTAAITIHGCRSSRSYRPFNGYTTYLCNTIAAGNYGPFPSLSDVSTPNKATLNHFKPQTVLIEAQKALSPFIDTLNSQADLGPALV